jgi:hypothetical protein
VVTQVACSYPTAVATGPDALILPTSALYATGSESIDAEVLAWDAVGEAPCSDIRSAASAVEEGECPFHARAEGWLIRGGWLIDLAGIRTQRDAKMANDSCSLWYTVSTQNQALIVVIVSCFKLFFLQLSSGFAHTPQGSSIDLNVQHFNQLILTDKG